MTSVATPTSRCKIGIASCDITPPVGIYHRFWGAARHDAATGVHRPLAATAIALWHDGDADSGQPFLLVAIDHCLFRPVEMDELLNKTAAIADVSADSILFLFSHTHSGSNVARDRSSLPGGEKIGPYLDSLPEIIGGACRQAIGNLQPATMTYAKTTCDMGHDRDFWDEKNNRYVCGFNPDAESGLPVQVIRVSDRDNCPLATIVNYPCHATTLAWDNTLISPDYIGALRETIESTTGEPCIFLPAPCGDIGPRVGFVGDTDIADSNGRQLAYAALSALESMPPAQNDFHYCGPVLSGATLGKWEFRPLTEERQNAVSSFRHRQWSESLKYRDRLPTVADTEHEYAQLLADEAAARQANDDEEAQRCRALAERKHRLLDRIRPLPQEDTYPFRIDAWQIGDAFWVAVEGEPYFDLQEKLTSRFSDQTIIVIPLANGSRCSYLPTAEAFDKPLYQVDVALLAASSLELVTNAIETQIAGWLEVDRPSPG